MVVIAEKFGQLGNRLFLFAHFIAWCIEYNVALANPAFDEYAKYFEGTSRDPWCRYPSKRSRLPLPRTLAYAATRFLARASYRLKLRSHLIKSINIGTFIYYELSDYSTELKSAYLVLVRGWQYRDEPNLSKYADAIRRYFTPVRSHVDNASALIRVARSTCDVLIGLHIRRGDYKTFMYGEYFYDLDVYRDIAEHAAGLFPGKRVSFLVCSDEAVDTAIFGTLNVLRGTSHLVEDLYSFAGCDFLIGPPSSYTLWASYYGNVPMCQITSKTMRPTKADFAMYEALTGPNSWSRRWAELYGRLTAQTAFPAQKVTKVKSSPST
jgi:hypothetical protein